MGFLLSQPPWRLDSALLSSAIFSGHEHIPAGEVRKIIDSNMPLKRGIC